MAEPGYEDADALLADIGKVKAKVAGKQLTGRDVAYLYLKQAWRTGVQDAGGPVAIKRAEGRECGCPYSGGKCAAKEGA